MSYKCCIKFVVMGGSNKSFLYIFLSLLNYLIKRIDVIGDNWNRNIFFVLFIEFKWLVIKYILVFFLLKIV